MNCWYSINGRPLNEYPLYCFAILSFFGKYPFTNQAPTNGLREGKVFFSANSFNGLAEAGEDSLADGLRSTLGRTWSQLKVER